MHKRKGFAGRLMALVALGLVAACVITTDKPFFTEADFSQPNVLSGDWQKVPTAEDPEVFKVRFEAKGKLVRAQPLTEAGAVDEGEEPIDFGVVPLDGGRYIVAHNETDGSASYVGLVAEEGRLAFYFFDGGDAEDASAFQALLVDLEISRDPSFPSEARLAGENLSAAKIKALFSALLDDPEKYEAEITEYVPAK